MWRTGDPEPLDDVVLVPTLDDAGLSVRSGPWTRDDADGHWVCACTDCAVVYRRVGLWPSRWPWADLVTTDGPLREVVG